MKVKEAKHLLEGFHDDAEIKIRNDTGYPVSVDEIYVDNYMNHCSCRPRCISSCGYWAADTSDDFFVIA